MRISRLLILCGLMIGIMGCATAKPVAIRAGEPCFHCRRPIAQTELAAQILDHDQRSYQFSSVTCLVDYLKSHPGDPIRAMYATDYDRHKPVLVDEARFVAFKPNPQRRAVEYAAFVSLDAAKAFAERHQSAVLNWGEVYAADAAHATH
jgi:hypothetical protein